MPASSEIVAAMDADSAGRELAQTVLLAVMETFRDDLIFNAHLPTQEGDDWNRVLQNPSILSLLPEMD